MPITLAPGQSCTLRVQFLPTAAGVFNDQLTIISTASASPTLVLLRGVGVIPLPVSTLSPLGLLLLVFSMGLLGWVALRPQAI